MSGNITEVLSPVKAHSNRSFLISAARNEKRAGSGVQTQCAGPRAPGMSRSRCWKGGPAGVSIPYVTDSFTDAAGSEGCVSRQPRSPLT